MDERTDAKIKKQDCHHQIDLEVAMFRPRSPGISQVPKSLQEEQREQCEEDSCSLMPERSSGAGKRPPECPSKATATLGRLTYNAAGHWRTLAQVAERRARNSPFLRPSLYPELAPAHQCRNSPSPSASQNLSAGECRSQAFDLDEPCPHRKSVAAESNYVTSFWKAKYGKKNATILARGG